MRRCLKIRVFGKIKDSSYPEYVKKSARKLSVEGTIYHEDDGSVVIHACGTGESLDELIDALYKGTPKTEIDEVSTETVNSEKDFRGVFRVLGFD